MTKDEIIDAIINILRQHQQKLRGIVQQEPYKGDIFALFAEAYNKGLIESLHPDALCPILLSRAPDVVDSETEYTPWSQFRTIWDEWTYAWDHVNQLRPR